MTGWITNKGKVIECNTYEHLKVNDDVLKAIWSGYQESLDEIERDCMQLGEQGEHPEWHIFEMAQDRYEREAYRDAYKIGYLRLSTWSGRDILCVEGLSNWFETHKYVLKELADKLGCRIETTAIRTK